MIPMNRSFWRWNAGLIALVLILVLPRPGSCAEMEQFFDVLQIGTHTYTNVTVTSKTRNYVFIVHAGGMTNIKLAEVPRDILVRLGYPDPAAPKVQTNAAAVWARKTIEKLPVQQIKNMEQQVKEKLVVKDLAGKLPFEVPTLSRNLIYAVGATLLALYLFYSFCCNLICKKAGIQPGILIWMPILQLLPLLQAARMSRWWFLAYFVPILNIVAQVMWSFKIADARNKSAIIGVFLLLPFLQIFAFLLLAFADKIPSRAKPVVTRPVEMMTLETV